MATHVWVLVVALGVTALINWGAVARGDYVVDRITRPTFLLLLAGLAWSLYGDAEPGIGAPTLLPVGVALGLALVADVALLNATEGRFIVGVGVAVLSAGAWAWAILDSRGPEGLPWFVLAAAPALVLLHARLGRDVVRFAGADRGPVFAQQVALAALVLVAAWRGDWLVLLGAFVLAGAAAILGHDRFVSERRWAPVQAVATQHCAQVLLVVGLFR